MSVDQAHMIELALAVLVDSDARPWTDDRYTRWRDHLATFDHPEHLPEAARAYARARHIHGGFQPIDRSTFAAHYRGLVAVLEQSAPTPPAATGAEPVLEADDALAAIRALRASTWLAHQPGPAT